LPEGETKFSTSRPFKERTRRQEALALRFDPHPADWLTTFPQETAGEGAGRKEEPIELTTIQEGKRGKSAYSALPAPGEGKSEVLVKQGDRRRA